MGVWGGAGPLLCRAGFVVAALFPLLGVAFRLHLFADGSLFSYGVAACDGWEFHFRQIPTRVAAFALAGWPAERVGCALGAPALGVALYGALFFAAPLAGLLLTRWLDRTGRLLPWAAASVLLLCPMVFGFPSELWVAQAASWPALALCLSPGGARRWLGAVLAFAAMACAHEAGLVWALLVVASLAAGPRRGLVWGGLALAPALLLWIGLKLSIRPDPYVAQVVAQVAHSFLDPALVLSPANLLPLAAAGGFAAGVLLLRRLGPALLIAAVAGGAMALLLGAPLPAEARYHARTLLFAGNAALLLLAVLEAVGRLPVLPDAAQQRRLVLGVVAIALAINAVQLARFLVLWEGYRAAVAALAMGEAADPALGDAEFVSAARVDARFEPLAWHSTTPFLSVLVAPAMNPRRLVVDPEASYFWFACPAATRSAARDLALPAGAREKIRRYACLHRRE